MITLVLLVICLYLVQRYKPEAEFIHESQMWVVFYSKGERGEYFIIWKK